MSEVKLKTRQDAVNREFQQRQQFLSSDQPGLVATTRTNVSNEKRPPPTVPVKPSPWLPSQSPPSLPLNPPPELSSKPHPTSHSNPPPSVPSRPPSRTIGKAKTVSNAGNIPSQGWLPTRPQTQEALPRHYAVQNIEPIYIEPLIMEPSPNLEPRVNSNEGCTCFNAKKFRYVGTCLNVLCGILNVAMLAIMFSVTIPMCITTHNQQLIAQKEFLAINQCSPCPEPDLYVLPEPTQYPPTPPCPVPAQCPAPPVIGPCPPPQIEDPHSISEPLECFECFSTQNPNSKPKSSEETSCFKNPQSQTTCKQGQYCGIRYREVESGGIKSIERYCAYRNQNLNPGRFSCSKNKSNGVKETNCWCNDNLCLNIYEY